MIVPLSARLKCDSRPDAHFGQSVSHAPTRHIDVRLHDGGLLDGQGGRVEWSVWVMWQLNNRSLISSSLYKERISLSGESSCIAVRMSCTNFS